MTYPDIHYYINECGFYELIDRDRGDTTPEDDIFLPEPDEYA
jgi:hypothetical protein